MLENSKIITVNSPAKFWFSAERRMPQIVSAMFESYHFLLQCINYHEVNILIKRMEMRKNYNMSRHKKTEMKQKN